MDGEFGYPFTLWMQPSRTPEILGTQRAYRAAEDAERRVVRKAGPVRPVLGTADGCEPLPPRFDGESPLV